MYTFTSPPHVVVNYMVSVIRYQSEHPISVCEILGHDTTVWLPEQQV